MKVDIILRSDFATKFGGDVLQAQHYQAGLGGSVDCRLVASGPRMQLRPGAIAHFMNIDLGMDFLLAAEAARGRPFVVSPVHHADSRMRSVSRARPLSARKVAEAVLPPSARELARHAARNGIEPRALRRWRPNLRREVAAALLGADAVLCLARGEVADLERDFAVTLPRARVLPNGLPSWDEPPPGARAIPVLVPGRIEPRKNQLRVAQELAGHDVPAVFIGAANQQEARYVGAFEQVLAGSPQLTWIPGLPAQQMKEHYQRAAVVLNLSLAEVLSLVDLEAFAAGCHLVTSRNGNTQEWLGSSAEYFATDQTTRAVARAVELARRGGHPERPAAVLEALSWASVVRNLEDVYAEVTARHRTPSRAC